nr:hypothetical protein [Tanacetum cinerariifolium]
CYSVPGQDGVHGIEGIAKEERGWFLGCDLSLDCREGREEATLFETSLASLEVFDESFKQAIGTGELTVGMGDSIVSVSICSAEGLNVEAVELGFPLPSGT